MYGFVNVTVGGAEEHVCVCVCVSFSTQPITSNKEMAYGLYRGINLSKISEQ